MRLAAKTKRVRKSTSTVKLRTNGKHKIDAASTVSVPSGFGMGRILRPQARYNWLLPSLAAITPQFIEMTLNGAMAGNHVQQYELFDLMLRTWPELSACSNELFEGVLRKKLVFEPFCEEDEKPTPSAIEKSKLVSAALRDMEPDAENDGNDLEGTLKNILDAWIRGFSVSEIVWQTVEVPNLGTINAPRTTFWVDVVQYAFSSQNMIGLSPRKANQGFGIFPFTSTSPNQTIVEPFPPNKFLVAIHKAKSGSPLAGPLLAPLAWWWCAQNFCTDWMLNLAQLFGLPFRWASYPQGTPIDKQQMLADMLQNMGSAGWAVLQEGQQLNFENKAGEGTDRSPQGELAERANKACRTLILGQTMTGTHGTTGKGGGQAFGKVEHEVKEDRIDAAGKFACSVINRQLIPYILNLNYGETSEAPTIKFLEDEVADFTEAQRDQVLINAGLPIGVDYLRKKYDIPVPADGEEIVGGVSLDLGREQNIDDPLNQNPIDPNAPQDGNPPQDQQQDEPAKAGDKPGHAFHGNQHVNIGEIVNTPHGRGMVVAQSHSTLWVSTNKGIKQVPRMSVTKIPKMDEKKFPGISQSAENERRAHLNAQLHSKLKSIASIPDDAIYSRELSALATSLSRGIIGVADGDFTEALRCPVCHGRSGMKSVAAGDAVGHPFRGNQWTTDPIQNGTRIKFHSGEYKGATGTVRGVIARTNPGNKTEDIHNVDIEYPNGMKFNKTPLSVSHIKENAEKL